MRVSLGGSAIITAQERLYAEIRAGRAFMHFGNVAVLAGNFSTVQLFNPLGSGKTLIVQWVSSYSVTGAVEMRLGKHDIALTTDQGTGQNMRSGGANSVAHVRVEQSAAAKGTSYGALQHQAGDSVIWSTPWAIELPDATGLVVAPTIVAAACVATFMWIEV